VIWVTKSEQNLEAVWQARIRRAQELTTRGLDHAHPLQLYAPILEFQYEVAQTSKVEFRPGMPLREQIDPSMASAHMPALVSNTECAARIYSVGVNNRNQTYPVIKSPALRKVAEYSAAALLFVTIILGLTASEAVTMISLGLFLMVAAFALSGIRGALAFNSLWQPMRKAGRIAVFSIGVFSLVLGVLRLHP